jgi:hypothetical protein
MRRNVFLKSIPVLTAHDSATAEADRALLQKRPEAIRVYLFPNGLEGESSQAIRTI